MPRIIIYTLPTFPIIRLPDHARKCRSPPTCLTMNTLKSRRLAHAAIRRGAVFDKPKLEIAGAVTKGWLFHTELEC